MGQRLILTFTLTALVLTAAGAARAAEKQAEFVEAGSDKFFGYHLKRLKWHGKETGDVFWAIENKTKAPMEIGSLVVHYNCTDGKVQEKTHNYGCMPLAPGEKKSYVGADKVCLFKGFQLLGISAKAKGDAAVMGNSLCTDGKSASFLIDETSDKYVKVKTQSGQTVTMSGSDPVPPEKLAQALCGDKPLPGDLMKKFIDEMSKALHQAADKRCKERKDEPQCPEKLRNAWFGVRD